MPLLSAAEIEAVGQFDSDFDKLWMDVQLVADRVHETEGDQRAWAWQHLLLAVANFKAWAELRLPSLPVISRFPDPQRREVLTVPVAHGVINLHAEEAATWDSLCASFYGLGVPRTTTVLSALWPDRHVIMDWRALSSAVALAGSRLGWEGLPVHPHTTDQAPMTWGSYAWYRDAVLKSAAEARVRPVELERALYRITKRARGARWAEYAALIERVVAGHVRDAEVLSE